MQTIPTRGAAPPMPPRAPAPPSNGAAYQPAPAAVVQLANPVAGHHGMIAEIHLREPTYGDYIDCGPLIRRILSDDPDQPGRTRIEAVEDGEALTKWICRLSGLPEAVLRLLSWRDGKAVAREVAAIIQEMDAGNSSARTTSDQTP